MQHLVEKFLSPDMKMKLEELKEKTNINYSNNETANKQLNNGFDQNTEPDKIQSIKINVENTENKPDPLCRY